MSNDCKDTLQTQKQNIIYQIQMAAELCDTHFKRQNWHSTNQLLFCAFLEHPWPLPDLVLIIIPADTCRLQSSFSHLATRCYLQLLSCLRLLLRTITSDCLIWLSIILQIVLTLTVLWRWCHDIGYPLLAAKHSLCKAPWSGTPCRTTSTHSRTMSPLDSAWKPGFSLATSVLSALETLWQLCYINSHLQLPLLWCLKSYYSYSFNYKGVTSKLRISELHMD